MKKTKLIFTLVVLMTIVYSKGMLTEHGDARLSPRLLNYQGYLTDDQGIPITDPSLSMTFSVYDALSNGNQKWTETQSSVEVDKGVFSVLLGSVTPIPDSVFNTPDRWLELTVAGQTLTPRTRIVSSAYAYTSTYSDTADYAHNAAADNDWTFLISDGADTTLQLGGRWGLVRYGNTMIGYFDSTHVCFGVGSITGFPNQNFKYCTVGGGSLNKARGTAATIAGGYDNHCSSTGNGATIGGGYNNNAGHEYSTIAGGNGNYVSQAYGIIGGGYGNQASGHSSTIGGGYLNRASSTCAVVSGGQYNKARGQYSVVVGGGGPNEADSNSAIGTYATIGGGRSNIASVEGATVGGGLHNLASGIRATVGGGLDNIASGIRATVGGGYLNTASFQQATVSGGYNNTASGVNATVGGGENNTASNTNAFAGGGMHNKARGQYSVVNGGGGPNEADSNSAIGNYSAIGGGYHNIASGNSAVISGGCSNVASNGYSSVCGGYGNQANGVADHVAGGQINVVNGGNSTIGGGWGNSILGMFSTICGGYADTITADGDYSYLFGINSNLTQDSTFMVDMPHIRFGTEATGYEFPKTDGTNGQALVTDGSGQVSWGSTVDADWSFLVSDGADTTLQMGGRWGITRYGNTMYGNADSTHVNLGVGCVTGTNGQNYKYITVSGGDRNTASYHYTTIGGGLLNTASGSRSTVSGGGGNMATGLSATVGGGGYNTAGGDTATVSGGCQNIASGDRTTIGGGTNNTASGYSSVIGGGRNNSVTDSASIIGGGYQNHIAGNYSAILGGYADTITADGDYSYLFGINSNLTQDSTFMVDMPHIRFGTEAAGYEFPKTDGTNGQALVTDGSGQVSWGSSGDMDWVINGSNMYSGVGGNVGIGRNNPGYKLDIYAGEGDVQIDGSSNNSAGLRLTNSNGLNHTWALWALGWSGYWGSVKGFAIGDITKNATRLVIDTLGNTGINVTLPSSRLDIAGTNGYDQFRMRTTYTPSSSSDANGNVGDVAWDDNYVYVKTSAGWKRSALTTW